MVLNIYGVVITDKIRAILLFESDINFSNKLYFGSRLIKRANISGILPLEQRGVRSGHTSIEVAVLRSLVSD